MNLDDVLVGFSPLKSRVLAERLLVEEGQLDWCSECGKTVSDGGL